MSTPPPAPGCLAPAIASLYRSGAGPTTLTLTDITGNSDFDITLCQVRDITAKPSVPVPNTALTPKQWSFTLAPARHYSLQLVVIQLPAAGSSATVSCCVTLSTIDQTNQIQTWKVFS